MEDEIGKRLVQAVKSPEGAASSESFIRALEITKAYAGSGASTHFTSVARLFYDLFELFETGKDPRK